MADVLAYVAAALVGLWGISHAAHAAPTRRVVAGFEPTAADNHWVILQEWLAEASVL